VASIVPLVIASFPFVSRLVETSMREVDAGVIEAAQSMGATPLQIITLVMICSGVAPMLWAASTTPESTSRMLVSTRRDTNGKDAMTSGTMDATVPIEVPTIKRMVRVAFNGTQTTDKPLVASLAIG